MVLNVVGSSPTGHPKKKSPVIQEIAGLLHFQSMRFYVIRREIQGIKGRRWKRRETIEQLTREVEALRKENEMLKDRIKELEGEK